MRRIFLRSLRRGMARAAISSARPRILGLILAAHRTRREGSRPPRNPDEGLGARPTLLDARNEGVDPRSDLSRRLELRDVTDAGHDLEPRVREPRVERAPRRGMNH